MATSSSDASSTVPSTCKIPSMIDSATNTTSFDMQEAEGDFQGYGRRQVQLLGLWDLYHDRFHSSDEQFREMDNMNLRCSASFAKMAIHQKMHQVEADWTRLEEQKKALREEAEKAKAEASAIEALAVKK